MQLIAHIQLLIFLFFLPFGQTIAFDKKSSARATIFCCTLGFDFDTAVDVCQYWGANCEGGWPACATTAVEQSLCSQCLADPTRAYCSAPITQNKRDLNSGDTSLAKNIIKKSVTFEEPNLYRRASDRYDFVLAVGVKQVSVTLLGVVFNFIVNQANDIYVSILNENGFPVIASIVDAASGWSEREPLPDGGHAAYQQTKGSQPGNTFSLMVQT